MNASTCSDDDGSDADVDLHTGGYWKYANCGDHSSHYSHTFHYSHACWKDDEGDDDDDDDYNYDSKETSPYWYKEHAGYGDSKNVLTNRAPGGCALSTTVGLVVYVDYVEYVDYSYYYYSDADSDLMPRYFATWKH